MWVDGIYINGWREEKPVAGGGEYPTEGGFETREKEIPKGRQEKGYLVEMQSLPGGGKAVGGGTQKRTRRAHWRR